LVALRIQRRGIDHRSIVRSDLIDGGSFEPSLLRKLEPAVDGLEDLGDPPA